jgi:hypothetical protein
MTIIFITVLVACSFILKGLPVQDSCLIFPRGVRQIARGTTATICHIVLVPDDMMMSVNMFVEWEFPSETEVLQFHFIHQTYRMTLPGIEPELLRWEASD